MRDKNKPNELYLEANNLLREGKIVAARKLLQKLAESRYSNSEMILAHTVLFIEKNENLIPECLIFLKERALTHSDLVAATYLESYYREVGDDINALTYVEIHIKNGVLARHYTIYRMLTEGKISSNTSNGIRLYQDPLTHLKLAADAGHIFAIRDKMRSESRDFISRLEYIFNRLILLPIRAFAIGLKNPHDPRLLP